MTDTIENMNSEEILTRRAAKYAAIGNGKADAKAIEKIAVVAVGSQKFGIATESLSVIVHAPSIAALPELPPLIRGIAQIRGEIIGIVDIAGWFAVGGACTGKLLAVLNGEWGKLGILVDEVLGFKDIYENDVADHLVNMARERMTPIRFTTKDMISVIDVSEVFNSKDLVVDVSGEKYPEETL